MTNTQPHILVVDDHKDIREPLGKYLAQNGFVVSTAANGTEMNTLLKASTFDLIILDILMPGENGLEICRRVRITKDIPIILLTAVTEDVDKIVGLELGADDYVSKPFNPRELLARIKNVLRRVNSLPKQFSEFTSGTILFADWQLDISQQTLTKKGQNDAIQLSTVEFRLLTALLANPNVVLSRDRLLDLVCQRESEVFDRSIDNQISRLRKKIDPDIKNPKIIKTVWGDGYMLTADVVKI